jgi:hypothetical protein
MTIEEKAQKHGLKKSLPGFMTTLLLTVRNFYFLPSNFDLSVPTYKVEYRLPKNKSYDKKEKIHRYLSLD